jgi:Ser/Thr protein kinase RdoA (MazF antagonist)
VIHGDFGIHNLIFPSKGPPVPIDFELSRRDWRMNDLISAAGKHRLRGGAYDLESMRVFIEAYDERLPLAPSERELFAQIWSHYKLRAAVQYWNSYHLTEGPARKLQSALDSISQAREVLENPTPIQQLATT